MVTKILFILFCIIAFFVALGLIISGLAKKRTQIWISGIALLLFSVLTPAYVILQGISNGVRNTIEYASSDRLQKDARSASKTIGKTTGSIISGQIEGMAETLDEEAFMKLAQKSARIVGKGIIGLTAELNGTLGTTLVYTSQQADELGIRLGRAQPKKQGSTRSVSLFTEFKKPFSGTLQLESYDNQGKKMDTSLIRVTEVAGVQKHLDFVFSQNAPGLSGYCILLAYLDN